MAVDGISKREGKQRAPGKGSLEGAGRQRDSWAGQVIAGRPRRVWEGQLTPGGSCGTTLVSTPWSGSLRAQGYCSPLLPCPGKQAGPMSLLWGLWRSGRRKQVETGLGKHSLGCVFEATFFLTTWGLALLQSACYPLSSLLCTAFLLPVEVICSHSCSGAFHVRTSGHFHPAAQT